MNSAGTIFTDPSTGKQYERQAFITISPTLITDRPTTYGFSDQVIGNGPVGTETPKTMVLVDEDGNEFVAVLVDQEVDFTATPNDIREGKVAATDDGVTIGEKFIPSYVVTEGFVVATKGSQFKVRIGSGDLCKYTKFQAIICPYNENFNDSVAADKVVINNNVYAVLSTESLSVLNVNSSSKTIEFGVTNDTSSMYLIRYFTYKEVY